MDSLTVEQVGTLLGVPYRRHGNNLRGLDCWGLVEYVAGLLGIPGVGSEELGPGWEKVGERAWDANRVGDIIAASSKAYLTGDEPPTPDHVAIVTNSRKRLCLSSCQESGVYQAKTWMVANVVAVYRWVGGA